MDNFRENVYKTIRADFANHLDLKDRANTTETKKRYLDDLEFYINNHLARITIFDDYPIVFDKDAIKAFLTSRKSTTAKYALSNLLNYFHFNRRISDSYFLEINNELRKYKINKGTTDFLTKEDIKFIFGSRINYKRDKEQELLLTLQLILSLSYHCMFEQNHIYELKWKDVNLLDRTIQNSRSINDPFISKKISLDENTYNLLGAYSNIKNTGIHNPDEYMFVHLRENKNSINNVLGILNHRKHNYSNLTTRVNLQKVIRTRVLIDLIDSDGKELMNFYKIMGLKKDTQLNSAIKEYLVLINSKIE